MTLAQRQQALTDRLSAIGDSQERFSWLVEQANLAPSLDSSLKTDSNLISGCLAKLWIAREYSDGLCRFHADSDSKIVKAIASQLCNLCDGLPPSEVLLLDPSFLGPLGISREFLAEKWMRDARITDIYEGTGQINRLVVARQILGYSGNELR